MHSLVLVSINLLSKFEMPSFTHSKDIMGLQSLQVWAAADGSAWPLRHLHNVLHNSGGSAVDRAKLATLATVDVPHDVMKFLSPEFGTKFQREVTLFLEILEFLYSTV